MANQAARDKLLGTSYDKLVVLDRAGSPCIFPRVDQMLILGTLMDDKGDVMASVEHRLAAARQHFYARRKQFCCPRIPLACRIRRFYGTAVGKTVTWDAGGWTPGTQALQRIEAFELRMLRKICQVPRGSEENFVLLD